MRERCIMFDDAMIKLDEIDGAKIVAKGNGEPGFCLNIITKCGNEIRIGNYYHGQAVQKLKDLVDLENDI